MNRTATMPSSAATSTLRCRSSTNTQSCGIKSKRAKNSRKMAGSGFATPTSAEIKMPSISSRMGSRDRTSGNFSLDQLLNT